MSLVLPLKLLAMTPMWILVLALYFLTIGVIWTLRDCQERLGYNVARSAQLGDAALVAVILIAIGMLQEGRSVDPALNTWVAQGGFLVIAASVAVIWIKLDPTKRWGDRYHHIVVAPMLVYLGLNAAIIILFAGARWEIISATILSAFWAGLVASDFKTGRMDQRQWLKEQGITGLKN